MFAGILSGCELTFLYPSEPVTIKGYVTHDNLPLADVKIKSDFYNYATTNSQGYYEFVTHSKSIKFYAKKAGYTFLPKVYDYNQQTTNYDFEAQKAVPLNGALALSQILISPTSIISIPGNDFDYQNNKKSFLKLAEFNFIINSGTPKSITPLNQQNIFLEKNTFTNILNQKHDFALQVTSENNGKINVEFSFLLKAYYKVFALLEEASTERHLIFTVSEQLDTGDLDENGNIKFSIPGINSYQGGFTYNIQFVFNYQPN